MHRHNIAHMDHPESKQHTLPCHHSLAWNSGQSSRPSIVRHPTTIISGIKSTFSHSPHTSYTSYHTTAGQDKVPQKRVEAQNRSAILQSGSGGRDIHFKSPQKYNLDLKRLLAKCLGFPEKGRWNGFGLWRNAIKYLAGASEPMRPEGLKVPSTFLGQSGVEGSKHQDLSLHRPKKFSWWATTLHLKQQLCISSGEFVRQLGGPSVRYIFRFPLCRCFWTWTGCLYTMGVIYFLKGMIKTFLPDRKITCRYTIILAYLSREHPKGAIQETCHHWDIWSEWWGETWPDQNI